MQFHSNTGVPRLDNRTSCGIRQETCSSELSSFQIFFPGIRDERYSACVHVNMHVHVSVYVSDIIYILNISHFTIMYRHKSVQYRILSEFMDALKPLLVIGGRCYSPILYRCPLQTAVD